MTKRVALYARVSTGEQRDAETIRPQVDAIKAYAAAQGYEVVDTYLDDGVSGGKAIHKRPAGGRMIADAAEGGFDGVVVSALDRLGRDKLNIAMQVERLRRRNITVEAVEGRIVFDNTAAGGMALSMFSLMAEWERAEIRKRTMRGRKKGGEDGRIVNPNAFLFGYDLIKKSKTQATAYVVNDAQAAVVQEIFERFTTTHGTVRSLMQYMRMSGHAPPKGRGATRWHKTSLRKILSNHAYIGEFWQGRWKVEHLQPDDPDDLEAEERRKVSMKNREEWDSPVPIPEIVERAIWEKAQRLLATNGSLRRHRPTGEGHHRRRLRIYGRAHKETPHPVRLAVP
jgi:site-specific DNA recombinase